MEATAESKIQSLFDEIALSFSTLDEEAPRETIKPCPRCGEDVLVMKDQLSGKWEVSCCEHAELDKIRSQAVIQWNEWVKP